MRQRHGPLVPVPLPVGHSAQTGHPPLFAAPETGRRKRHSRSLVPPAHGAGPVPAGQEHFAPKQVEHERSRKAIGQDPRMDFQHETLQTLRLGTVRIEPDPGRQAEGIATPLVLLYSMGLGDFPDPGVHRGAHFAHFRSVSVSFFYFRIVTSGRPGSFRIGSHQSVHCPVDDHPSHRSRTHRRLQQHIPLAGILPQIGHQRPAPPTSGGQAGGQRVAIRPHFGEDRRG